VRFQTFASAHAALALTCRSSLHAARFYSYSDGTDESVSSSSLSSDDGACRPARGFQDLRLSERPGRSAFAGAPFLDSTPFSATAPCSRDRPRRTRLLFAPPHPPPPYSCPYPCSYCTLPRLTTTSPPARVPTGEQRTARIALHIAPGRQPTHLPCGRTRRRVILSLRVEVAELIAARRARPSRFQSTGAAPRSGEGAAPQLGRELDAQPLLPCARAATPPHPPGPAG